MTPYHSLSKRYRVIYSLVFDSLDAKQMPQPLIIQGLQHF